MATNTGVIRPFVSVDFERVTEIYDLSHAAEYAGEVVKFPPEYLLDSPVLLDLFHASDVFVFDDGEIKGFVGYQDEKIIWLYVDPDYQGQRIGLRLIDFVMGLRKNIATLTVVKSNLPALGLYQNLGFKVVGEFEFDYQNQPVKALNLISEHALKLIDKLNN